MSSTLWLVMTRISTVLATWSMVIFQSLWSADIIAGPQTDPPAQPFVGNLQALRRSLEHLSARHGEALRHGAQHLAELDALERVVMADPAAVRQPNLQDRIRALAFNALVVDNPAISFDRLLAIRREPGKLALPQNWQGNSSIAYASNMRNDIVTLEFKIPSAAPQVLFRPTKPCFVGDLDLDFDGQRLMFSSIGPHDRWQVFEISRDGSSLRQVTPSDPADVDNYAGIYLPDGRILFDSTSTFVGVPCVNGVDHVGNFHLMNADGTGIRRLCFDQDNNWCPAVMPDGKILYQRWEYTDSAHYFSRVLMRMNPDGTGQSEFYGSNSYWPNSLFYAKPIPGSTTRFVAVVGGHHGVPRMGELHLFDTAKGRNEDSGVVQQIPGWGKPFKGMIKDRLVDDSWPKFLHPVPLDDTYILVAAKPDAKSGWGIYLVDIFDNMVLIREDETWAWLEPIPLRQRPKPPVIPDRVDLSRKTASVFIQDIYEGPGLQGVPRGTVTSLRLFQYEYAYRNMGGHYVVGIEGPWDVRRIIGTVPVQVDGSCSFEVPANVPISLQPLDAEGKALQIMRSWFTAMPGEHMTCVGCHERQNTTTPVKRTLASASHPAVPIPWHGPKRGFSFLREVQPVLDRYCSGCHDGHRHALDLKDTRMVKTSHEMSSFPASYIGLHPYVRRNGPEGCYHLLTPLEFHADTSELIQMLRKGHHQVDLDAEAWDRLITWIDLNVPCYGTWTEAGKIPADLVQRRHEMKQRYAGMDEDIETLPDAAPTTAFQPPKPAPPRPAAITVIGWPLSVDQVRSAQQSLGQTDLTLSLGEGVTMDFKHIPAGIFAMGDINGDADECHVAPRTIAKPFWMATTEVSLRQFRAFRPEHANGFYDMHYKDQVRPGYSMDNPEFPVIRVSWEDADAFCRWLSSTTGRKVVLPTEDQWEWACRAGSDTPFWFGNLDTDFAPYANLADRQMSKLAVSGFVDPQPMKNPDRFWDFVPKDARFDDGTLHLAPVTMYQANPWGLENMHGNAAEWTADDYHPYPGQTVGEPSVDDRKVVRGGSWALRPKWARSGSRLSYHRWQRVHDVGFRVILAE